MKTILASSPLQYPPFRLPAHRHSAYRAAILLTLVAVGRAAGAQTNAPPGTPPATGTTNSIKFQETTVVGKLNQARMQIQDNLGATAYTIDHNAITDGSQGGNAPFNQVLLRAPGVAQDSAANGDLHVRGEHANLQYRINDVLLPEGITGFGLELDPRFVESLQLITGSLPAQYGFRTAGVVDIQTKSGAFDNGGTVEFYGGSHDTLRPSFELGGATTNFNYFIDGSYLHNSLGIENPTAARAAIHDITDQGRLFSYLSWLLDDTSLVNLMLSASASNFQVPNTPGLPAGTASGPGNPQWVPGYFDSTQLNERQNERNYYAVITYQKSVGDFDYQVSAIGRNSGVHFLPDVYGDLYFDGVASDVARDLYSGGLQGDSSYKLAESHTLRFGASLLVEQVQTDSTTDVFDLDATGNPTGQRRIVDNHLLHGIFGGIYLQDEWKLRSNLTLNVGARFDVFNSSFDDENQLSPRVNLVYHPTEQTTLHAGYARYFTPPPIENVSGSTVALFNGTSNASATTQDSPVKAERANYFDVGVSQEITRDFKVGVDGYYKQAKNQLDDGLFGQTLILAAFNYAEGRIYGVEFSASYAHEGFSSYANLALAKAEGKNWSSSEFLFDPTDAAYVAHHYIALDHDQTITGSFGVSYRFRETSRSSTRVYADAIYGSGLRQDATAPDGSNIPNGGTVSASYQVNLGVEQSYRISGRQSLKARIDVVNVTDNIYQLRSGSGVGVNAAQYGAPRGIFASLSYQF